MSIWRWFDTRENNLRRVIERVARNSREATPIEKEIFAAMKPRGGWLGILLFCAVVIGVVVAEKLNAFPLGAIAAVALLGALACIYSRGIPSGLGVALLLGGIVLAVASNTLHRQLKGIPIEDMDDSPLLVDVEGVLSTTPRSADESICEFDLFGPPRKGDVFNLRRTNGGGTLRVRVQGGSGFLVAGDHVRIRGQLHFYRGQTNPGERARRTDSYDDLPATLYVSDKALIQFVPSLMA